MIISFKEALDFFFSSVEDILYAFIISLYDMVSNTNTMKVKRHAST